MSESERRSLPQEITQPDTPQEEVRREPAAEEETELPRRHVHEEISAWRETIEAYRKGATYNWSRIHFDIEEREGTLRKTYEPERANMLVSDERDALRDIQEARRHVNRAYALLVEVKSAEQPVENAQETAWFVSRFQKIHAELTEAERLQYTAKKRTELIAKYRPGYEEGETRAPIELEGSAEVIGASIEKVRRDAEDRLAALAHTFVRGIAHSYQSFEQRAPSLSNKEYMEICGDTIINTNTFNRAEHFLQGQWIEERYGSIHGLAHLMKTVQELRESGHMTFHAEEKTAQRARHSVERMFQQNDAEELRLWKRLREHPIVRDRFGDETIAYADNELRQMSLARIASGDYGSAESEVLQLYHDAEVVPLIALDAYRQRHNLQSTNPYVHKEDTSYDGAIARYLAGIPDAVREEFEQQGEQSVLNVIRAWRALASEEDDEQKSPLRETLQKAVEKLSLEYLTHENGRFGLLALNVQIGLLVLRSEETSTAWRDIVAHPERYRDAVTASMLEWLTYFIDRDHGAPKVLGACNPEQYSEKAQEKYKHLLRKVVSDIAGYPNAPATYEGIEEVNNPTTQFLARAADVKPERIVTALHKLGQTGGLLRTMVQISNEGDLGKWIEFLHDDEARTFVLRLIQQTHYQFRIEEYPYVQELLNDPRRDDIVAGHAAFFKVSGNVFNIEKALKHREVLATPQLEQVLHRIPGQLIKGKMTLENLSDYVAMSENPDLMEAAVQLQERFGYVFNVQKREDLEAFVAQPDYRMLIDQYRYVYALTEQSFSFKQFSSIEPLLRIPDLADRLDSIPKAERSVFHGKPGMQLLIATKADRARVAALGRMLTHPYFNDKRDAQAHLDTLLDGADRNRYSFETAVRLLTVSEGPDNVRRATARFNTLIEFLRVQDASRIHDGAIDTTFITEHTGSYAELLKTIESRYVSGALRTLAPDDESLNRLHAQVDARKDDESFMADFEIIARAAMIYGAKGMMEGPRATLRGALLDALNLLSERDPARYAKKRFSESAPQFDRLFDELSDVNRASIETWWRDISGTTRERLDSATTDERQRLKNKLEEAQTMTETEIVPDLRRLLEEKLSLWRERNPDDEREREQLHNHLGVIDRFLLNADGEVRDDLARVYRELQREIKANEALLSAPETSPKDKKKIGQLMKPLRAAQGSIRGLYKLSSMNPERIERRVDYSQEIIDAVDLLAKGLDQLDIVATEKRAMQSPEDRHALETDIRGHLEHVRSVMSEQTVPASLWVEGRAAVDFNSLARCPELTMSCQRLTERTGHNESAFSRILDGIDELIDVWEIARRGRGFQDKERMARCFTELGAIQESGKKARPVLYMDRIYTHPQRVALQEQFARTIFKTAFNRMVGRNDIAIAMTSAHFAKYREVLESMAEEYGFLFRAVPQGEAEYFVNQSRVAMGKGKYYDGLGGQTDTSTARFVSVGTETEITETYIIEARPENA